MKSKIFMVAALIGLLTTGCQKEETTDLGEVVKTPVTITANYGKSNAKVSYTENGNTISASWQAGDKILVIYDGYVSELTLESGVGSASATFTGEISHRQAHTPSDNSILSCYVKDVNNGGALTIVDDNIVYSDALFMSQDGTVAGAGKCNTYHGMATYGTGTDITCDFAVNTSIMKFNVTGIEGDAGQQATLTYMSDGVAVCQATFEVSDNSNVIYIAIPSGHYSGEQNLVYTCGDDVITYQLSASQANFTAGQTYSKDVDIDYSYYIPLTMESKVANSTVRYEGSQTVEYRVNAGDWTTISSNTDIPLTNAGDKVTFRGNNASYNGCKIRCTAGACYIYGNIMSLISSTDYPTEKTLTSGYTFYELFSGNTNLFSHSTKDLLLPATTLTVMCYTSMFYNCTNLTKAPNLPAETLDDGCYTGMFQGCTSLTAAPDLPAETVKRYCYQYMFLDCTSLTTAPAVLPAITLAQSCYECMFKGCTSLTKAPILPASTLVMGCYRDMFSGCSSLNWVECHATSGMGKYTPSWLSGVAESGTFRKKSSAYWLDGRDYIPDGWTRVNI